MSMNFRDKAVFRINRNEVGDCTIDIRRHMLFIPYWFSLVIVPLSFTDCLWFIKKWCCERNIGNALIFDPNGANKKMLIKYRQYKGEVLNELKQ